jgi:hypothetical protein
VILLDSRSCLLLFAKDGRGHLVGDRVCGGVAGLRPPDQWKREKRDWFEMRLFLFGLVGCVWRYVVRTSSLLPAHVLASWGGFYDWAVCLFVLWCFVAAVTQVPLGGEVKTGLCWSGVEAGARVSYKVLCPVLLHLCILVA